MEGDQTLKILKMVQEGFLTPEQGQRLLQELAGATAQAEEPARGPTPTSNPNSTSNASPEAGGPDFFRLAEEAGKTLGEGFERLFGFAGQTVRDGLGLGPKQVVLKVLDADGVVERYQVALPYQVFTALKPLLVSRPSVVLHPIQQVDWSALFAALETGQLGRVFEYIDHARGERLEVWVR